MVLMGKRVLTLLRSATELLPLMTGAHTRSFAIIHNFPLAESLSLNRLIRKQSTVDYTTIIMGLTSASAVRALCYVFNLLSVFGFFHILST